MFNSIVQSFTAGATAQKFLSRSSKRWSLIVMPPLAGSITIGNNSGIVSGLGFNLQPTFGYVEIRANRHGQAVQDEWFVIADAAGRSFGFLESLGCECEQLAMLIDELGYRADSSGDPEEYARRVRKQLGYGPIHR